MAYAISTVSCLFLLTAYLGKVLTSYKASALFSFSLGALYGVLYIIIQMEDFALLMGALMLFAILALLMMSTRNINWYTISRKP